LRHATVAVYWETYPWLGQLPPCVTLSSPSEFKLGIRQSRALLDNLIIAQVVKKSCPLKGKVVPVLNLIKHYAMKAYGGVDV
jgi:hypothetical protein